MKRERTLWTLIVLLAFFVGWGVSSLADDLNPNTGSIVVEQDDERVPPHANPSNSYGNHQSQSQPNHSKSTASSASEARKVVESEKANVSPEDNAVQSGSAKAQRETTKEEATVENESDQIEVHVETTKVTLKGIVVNEEGLPVEGAYIRIQWAMRNADTGEVGAAPSILLGQSGIDGSFDLENGISIAGANQTHHGEARITASHPEYLESYPLESLIYSSKDFLQTDLTLVLRSGGKVKGRVVDQHGRSIPNLPMELQSSLGSVKARSNELGEILFPVSEACLSWIQVTHKGFQMNEFYRIDVRPNEEAYIGDIVVQRVTALTFRCVDAQDGTPLTGLLILSYGNKESPARPAQRSIEKDGKFFLQNVSHGQYDIKIEKHGYKTIELASVFIPRHEWTDLGTIEFQLDNTASQDSRATLEASHDK